jgi:PAS domain S-box-containing protein
MTQEGTPLPLRILLVEDDEDDYVLVRDALQALGPGRMTLEWIDDAARALEVMMAGRHDVCLLDNRLGADTGLELLEQARQRGGHIPVILLTGIEDRAADQRALESGAADFLVKSQMTPVLLERAIRYAVEHARMLEVLRRSQASFRELIERLPDGVSVFQDGQLIYANPELLRLAGVASSRELVGKRAEELSACIHPEDLPRLMQLRAMPPTERPAVEVRFLRKSGEAIWVEVAQFPVTFEGRRCKMGIARDLTERKQMQARLTAADRMATLGMAAGIVAHDINNPLAYVLTNLDHRATGCRG